MRLETLRADRNAEIDVLRSKVRTQEQIIRTMSQNEVRTLECCHIRISISIITMGSP